MGTRSFLFAFVTIPLFVGCGVETPENSAPEAAESSPAATESAAPETTASSGVVDLRKGGIVFLRCRSCHTLEPGGVHLTGPNLNGLFGAAAGTKEGYAFSPTLVESGIVWDEESMAKWLQNPAAFVPGNRMVFAGLPNADDRASLIAYLIENTRPAE